MSGYWEACSLQISLRLSVHQCNNYDDGDYFLFLVSYLIWCMINHVKENIPPLSEKSQVDYDQIYMTLVFLEHLFHRKKTMNACHLTLILDQLCLFGSLQRKLYFKKLLLSKRCVICLKYNFSTVHHNNVFHNFVAVIIITLHNYWNPLKNMTKHSFSKLASNCNAISCIIGNA